MATNRKYTFFLNWTDRKRHFILEGICALIVMLFLYTGITKLIELDEFQLQLKQSPIVRAFFGVISYSVPVMELLVATMILWSYTRYLALHISCVLMAAFTTYIALILLYADHLPCSCGGILEVMGWPEHLMFNLVFLLLAVMGIILMTSNSRFIPNND